MVRAYVCTNVFLGFFLYHSSAVFVFEHVSNDLHKYIFFHPFISIKVHSKPLDVVLHSTVVHQLRDFFTRRDQFGLALDWTARVRRRVRELRVQTAAELRGQIEELLDVEVEVRTYVLYLCT